MGISRKQVQQTQHRRHGNKQETAMNAAMIQSTSVAAKTTQVSKNSATISASFAPARPSSRVQCRAERKVKPEDLAPSPVAVESKPVAQEVRGETENLSGRAKFGTLAEPELTQEEEDFEKNWLGTMGFGGWAPEVINGRLAMVGILAGLGAGLAKGESIPTQFGAHFGAFFFASALVIAASFIPGIGNPAEMKKEDGPWSASAEMLNGRVAMVALALTIIVETVSKSSLL